MSNQGTMQIVLRRIFELKRAYNDLPFFQFLREERIDPAERMAFYPCIAHFILSFGDLNKYVLRREPAQDVYQERVNLHSYEDDHHWPWYLEDYQKLGFDRVTQPTDLLRFLWSDEARQSRLLMYRLTALIHGASGLERLAIIEAIEETGNVLFGSMQTLARTLEERLGVELRYCGSYHFVREAGHAMGSEHREIAAIDIDQATQERCLHFAEEVFRYFEAWTYELFHFTLAARIRKKSSGGQTRLAKDNDAAGKSLAFLPVSSL